MQYNFDQIYDRQGTGAMATDCQQENFGKTGLAPFWIADTGFAAPPFVVDALRQRLEHPIFGYTAEHPAWRPAIVSWVANRHNWSIHPEWLTFIPGIVKGIGMVINAFLRHDEKVIIMPPVYPPFRRVPEQNKREVITCPLLKQLHGAYTIDFDSLEAAAALPKTRLLILCNPHNPVGILWSRDDLRRIADICSRHNILVISDEIHCDMALWEQHHIPFASVSPEAEQCSITFQAPSKTFNVAGIVSSYAVVPNPALRQQFFSWLEANELNAPDIFAPIATVAAYTPQGEEWRRQMIAYVEANVRFVEEFCAEHLPQIHPIRPQASFLIWLDCRPLGLSQRQLTSLFIDKAGLALNDGATFGIEGTGYMRFNIGFPRPLIAQALHSLKAAITN